MMKFKSLFRRGQQSHLPHQQQQTGHPSPPPQAQLQQQPQVAQCLHPRQAPSVSSLEGKNDNIQNVNWQVKDSVKGTKVHGKSTGKNSNRMQELERELELLRKERARLEAGLRESTHDAKLLHELKTELAFVKEQHTLEVERLTEDNQVLRARLRDVAHSPLSDAEKHQLLQDAARDEPLLPPGDPNTAPSTDNPRCATPEWDKRSSSSVSEVSVACLQDRILQMEETHYSTNEELQATIQELSDLQAQLSELQTDNERLTEEKAVLLESLCRQTEKLEDSRSKVDTLQGLLLREEKPQDSSKGYNTEREQKLVDLLKSAQEERESLLQKLEELSSELKVLRSSAEASTGEAERLAKRVHHLEVAVEAGSAERKQLDVELVGARQESANRNIEISRLATLLENARAKIEELEQSRQVESKSEADELLDAARREKDTLETQAAALQEQLARSHCDHDRLRDQYSQLQEECKVTRNNAKSAIDDLEYRLSQLKEERLSVNTELQLVRDSLAELQAQCQRHLEDKRELKAALSEAQRREREAQLRQYELERSLNEEKKLRQSESAEWEQFQNDLLMTVRVANDFKTEAQSELERVVMENKTLRDRLRALEGQVEKLNKGPGSRSSSTSSLNSIGTNDILSLKAPLRDQQQINNLICSANPTNNNKTQSTGNRKLTLSESQKSSGPVSLSPGELLDSAALNAKAIDFVRRNSVTDLSERKDPLCGLVKNGGSKRNALLKWCQNKTVGYRNIDITNFSSSWNDGLALCAILHSYLPDKIPYDSLSPSEKRRNFSLAFSAAESVGIQTTLNIGDMCQLERPDWQQVMTYVTSIYKHFET
ncbi:cytospin-A isoform X4 [Diachasma alloeum]|uniref:cytospin-A isoform X4 n=1 Tax=Diachasma alloeum TaxID=454923 RepID=UPI000738503C|nr:cytospin-A isoform X4 [Diachasma alloeum]